MRAPSNATPSSAHKSGGVYGCRSIFFFFPMPETPKGRRKKVGFGTLSMDTIDLRSDLGVAESSKEQYTWDSSQYVGLPARVIEDLLRSQLDIVTLPSKAEDPPPEDPDCTIIKYASAGGTWQTWIKKFEEQLTHDIEQNQKPILAYHFESEGDEQLPLFLLAVNAIVRACIMGHSVCVRLPSHAIGVPGTSGSLRSHLCQLIKPCTESINIYDINQLYQTNLPRFM